VGAPARRLSARRKRPTTASGAPSSPAARRQHGLHDAAAVRHLHRRRLWLRHRLRRRRRLEDLAAAPYDAHYSGAGTAVVDVATTRSNANLVVDVYDLDEYGIGPLITR
jgi:hypothetical protein